MVTNKTLGSIALLLGIIILFSYTTIGANIGIPGVSEPDGYKIQCQVELDEDEIFQASCFVMDECRTITGNYFSLVDNIFGRERTLTLYSAGTSRSQDYDLSFLGTNKNVEFSACTPQTTNGGTFILTNQDGGQLDTLTTAWN